MDTATTGTRAPAPPATDFDSKVQAATGAGSTADETQADPQTLVDRLVAAGEWPEPALLREIIHAGDAAIGPLISVVRTYPRGWPQEAPLDHALGLLSILRPPAAIPELIEIIRRYGEDTGEMAAGYLGSFGAVAFEPLLEVCRDPAVVGYPRTHAISAAVMAAGASLPLRAQLADVIRPMLADAIERFRQTRLAEDAAECEESDDELPEYDDEFEDGGADSEVEPFEDESDSDLAGISESDDEPDDDQIEADSHDSQDGYSNRAHDLFGEVVYLVNDLAALADPGARDLIKTAFREDMVETFFIDEAFVEKQYNRGGEPVRKFPNWLDTYRDEYRKKHEPRPPARNPVPIRSLLPDFQSNEAASSPSQTLNTPVRNRGVAVGRNALCWCGSGKKYKKCHLGKDTRA